MKKLLILSLLVITLINVGCNNKSSQTIQPSTSSATLKCPNCGSTNVGDWHDTSGNNISFNGDLQECHICGMTFKK